MSYTPPAGNAVNFSWQGTGAYVAPVSPNVNFRFPADSFVATGAGTISITGAASGKHGYAATGAGTIGLTGSATATYTSTTITAVGAGTIALTAAAAAAHGVAGTAAGALAISGAASGKHGVAAAGAGSISFSGAASAIHYRYEVTGEVRSSGVLVNRHVRVYRRDTGALAGEGDTVIGKFRITTGHEAVEHYIVPLDMSDGATDYTPPIANRVTAVLAQD